MKQYYIATHPAPHAVPVKKEWEHKGLTLFLHRVYFYSERSDPKWRETKQWQVSEKSTGFSCGNQTFSTMKESIDHAHENIDKLTIDPRDLLKGKPILNI